MSQEAIIKLENVTISYGSGRGIFKNVNLSLPTGSFHYVTGTSGAGKSSLIRLLYLDQKSYTGKVEILGQDISKLTANEVATLRQKIGVVFQDFRLLTHLSVLDNVALPLRVKGLSARKARKIAEEILEWVGLEDHTLELPHVLSGGEQQRVSLARAVIGKPKLLLADEPTGSVDDAIAVKLLHLFEQLNSTGTTIVLATHNRDLTNAFPHNEIRVEGGNLSIQKGFSEPKVYQYAS